VTIAVSAARTITGAAPFLLVLVVAVSVFVLILVFVVVAIVVTATIAVTISVASTAFVSIEMIATFWNGTPGTSAS
jgi:hypothetical protein